MSLRSLASIVVAFGLSACATTDVVSRNAPIETAPIVSPDGAEIQRDYNVVAVDVIVPRELDVSERNGYYPTADIVWRGDPVGDRHLQIEQIFQTAAADAFADLNGARDVMAVIQLHRFHGVTERTRYSVGGVYNMEFYLSVYDAQTGAVIEAPRFLVADLPAPGGEAAVRLEQAGQTEKVRVLNYLTFFLTQEMSEQTGPLPAS